jgi:hypothetical protein
LEQVSAFIGIRSIFCVMNPKAVEIMREALEKISSIHQPTSEQAEKYDLEETLEKLDFAVVTAREALERAAMPGEMLN